MDISQVVTLVGTLVNAGMFIATSKMVYYTKKSLEAQNQPQIMVSLTPVAEDPLMMGILVENVGTGPAYDISFGGHESLEIRKGFLHKGIPYLAQKTSRIFWWDQFYIIEKDKLKEPVTISVYFSSCEGTKLVTKCVLDISDFKMYDSYLRTQIMRRVRPIP